MSNIENLILVCSTYIAASLMLIGGIIIVVHAQIRKNKLLYVFSGNWFLQALAWYLIGTAHLFYSPLLMAIGYIPQVSGAFLMFIFLEQTEKEQILASKMVVLTLIGTLYLIFTFLPLEFVNSNSAILVPTNWNLSLMTITLNFFIFIKLEIFRIYITDFYNLKIHPFLN